MNVGQASSPSLSQPEAREVGGWWLSLSWSERPGSGGALGKVPRPYCPAPASLGELRDGTLKPGVLEDHGTLYLECPGDGGGSSQAWRRTPVSNTISSTCKH